MKLIIDLPKVDSERLALLKETLCANEKDYWVKHAGITALSEVNILGGMRTILFPYVAESIAESIQTLNKGAYTFTYWLLHPEPGETEHHWRLEIEISPDNATQFLEDYAKIDFERDILLKAIATMRDNSSEITFEYIIPIEYIVPIGKENKTKEVPVTYPARLDREDMVEIEKIMAGIIGPTDFIQGYAIGTVLAGGKA